MQKISAAQVENMLNTVPDLLRKVASDRDQWRERAEAAEHRDRAVKLAARMHDRGLNRDQTLLELADQLTARTAADLDKYAAATDLYTGGSDGFSLEERSRQPSPSDPRAAFEHALMND